MPVRNGETKAVCLLIVLRGSKAGFGRCCPYRNIEQTARIFWEGEVCDLGRYSSMSWLPIEVARSWGYSTPEWPRPWETMIWSKKTLLMDYLNWWGLSNASERTTHNKGHSTRNQDSIPYNRQQKAKTKLKGHSPYFCRSQKNYKVHSSPRANENIGWSMTSFWIWAIPSGVEDWCSYFFLRQKCCLRFWLLIYKKNSSTLMDVREVP